MGLMIILGLLLWGYAEMSAFIYIGGEIGGLLTLLGVFVTAVVGIALLKRQGLSVLSRIQSDIAQGRAPVTSIADSIALVAGGALVLIPGYVTDAIGLLLFLPGFRTLAGVYLLQWLTSSQRFRGFTNVGGSFGGGNFSRNSSTHSDMDNTQPNPFAKHRRYTNSNDDIIEGEFEEKPGNGDQIGNKNGKRP
ncbi:MAG: FxsA family protein [Candidatus Puniceispirillum sp.]|nr:FxsA family protein [Candidatus Puniceispirillum sp.]MBL6774729.1 FxsA family protein [Candidatus Puniceispirillum sp.]